LVACIIRGDGVLVPGGTTRLLDGDRLVVVAQPENHGRTIRQLVGDE
jgi:Trk K+ transport system NAD-binding subunit